MGNKENKLRCMKAFSFWVSQKLNRVHILSAIKLILMIHTVYQYLSMCLYVYTYINTYIFMNMNS